MHWNYTEPLHWSFKVFRNSLLNSTAFSNKWKLSSAFLSSGKLTQSYWSPFYRNSLILAIPWRKSLIVCTCYVAQPITANMPFFQPIKDQSKRTCDLAYARFAALASHNFSRDYHRWHILPLALVISSAALEIKVKIKQKIHTFLLLPLGYKFWLSVVSRTYKLLLIAINSLCMYKHILTK